MAHQCPARVRRASTQDQVSSETAEVGRHVEFGRTGHWLEGSSARTVGRRRKTQGRAALRGSEGEGEKEQNTSGVGFPPCHGRAGRRGTAIPAAATDASTTTSTASPTQPVLPHPPPHQVSLDSSSRLSSRSSNRSSNLNSSPSSSSSRRWPRWAGFSSQALPTSAGWLAAVEEAEADVEAPKRGAVAPRDEVPDSQSSANRQSRQQGGGAERAGTLFADAGRSVGPRGAPKLGSVSPALFHGEKKRLNRNCSTDSCRWLNSQMSYGILPQNATTESREVRVSDTSHLT